MADDNATMQCAVLTPEGPVYQGEARFVSAPGSDGELGILRNHAPIVTSLGFGSLKVRTVDAASGDDSTQEWFVAGGFLEVLKNKVAVLAKHIEAIEDIDVEEARQRAESAGSEPDDDGFNPGTMARQRLTMAERYQKEKRGY